MPRHFLYLAAIYLYFSCYAQRDYTTIDKHSANARFDVELDYEKLTDYLVLKATDDHEKVRAFYNWIGHNLVYNTAEKVQIQTIKWHIVDKPNSILKKKKAICSEVAILFKAMCDHTNIPCLLVSGKATFEEKNKTFPHAWNICKVDGEWILIDATWGMSSPYSKYRLTQMGMKRHDRKAHDNYFVHIKNEGVNYAYFDTDPSEFIKEHLPDYAHHQLLERPITRQGFAAGELQEAPYLSDKKTFSPSELCDKEFNTPKKELKLFMEEMTVWTDPLKGITFAPKLEKYCDSKFRKVLKQGTIEEKQQLIQRYKDVRSYQGITSTRKKHPKIKRLEKSIEKMSH